MVAKTFIEEKRLFSRFKFEEGALVINQNIIGLLEDISLGGASFQYFDKGQSCLDGSAIEIILPFSHILIKAGQYKVINTLPPYEATKGRNQAQIKKHHIQFIDISSSEIQNLWQIIKIHSVRSWNESAFLLTPTATNDANRKGQHTCREFATDLLAPNNMRLADFCGDNQSAVSPLRDRMLLDEKRSFVGYGHGRND